MPMKTRFNGPGMRGLVSEGECPVGGGPRDGSGPLGDTGLCPMNDEDNEFDVEIEGMVGPRGSVTKITVEESPISRRLAKGSDLHGKLVSMLWSVIQDSMTHIEQREEDWTEVDNQNRLYADLSKGWRKPDKTESETKKNFPFEGSIVIPVSRSILDTRAAILYSIFMKSDPFAHLEASTGADFRGARLFEQLLQYDFRLSNLQHVIWQLVTDTDKYGLGCWYCSWEQDYSLEAQEVSSVPQVIAKLLGIKPEIEMVPSVSREWSNIRAINPRKLLLDPAVSPVETRKMLFIGHRETQNWIFFKERQIDDGAGPYFNVEELREVSKAYRRSTAKWQEGDYSDKTGDIDSKYPDIDISYIQMKLIPRDWELSESDRVEKWQFCVAGEGELIIRAHKLEYAHDEFTYRVGEFEPDEHAPFTQGMGTALIGGHNLVNWLNGSHVSNMKKIINDQIIYNDNLLNSKDVNNSAPARRIRLTQRGKVLHERGMMSINDMYGQFRITDVTGAHLETARQIYDFLQRIAATPDTVQGAPLPTKRTLGEIQGMAQSANVRLGIAAELLDMQVIMPIVEQMIANRQQFMSMEQAVRIAGDKASSAGREVVMVSPDQIRGKYDYIPHTPTVPPDPSRNLALWMQIGQMLANSPLAQMEVDGRRIDPFMVFKEILFQAGVEYFENFTVPATSVVDGSGAGGNTPGVPGVGGEMKAQVMSNEEVSKGVDAGNLVPIG